MVCNRFVLVKNHKLLLYSEEKKIIYSATSYKIDDENIDTPMYLIYTEHMDALMSNKVEVNICSEFDHVETKKCITEEIEPAVDLNEKLEGRSLNDVLDLFK